jgi:hypothetical protein
MLPNEDELSRLSLPELIELLHRIAEEIQLRVMEVAE